MNHRTNIAAEVAKFFKNPIVVVDYCKDGYIFFSFSFFTPVGKPIFEKMKKETSLIFEAFREGSMNSTATFKYKM